MKKTLMMGLVGMLLGAAAAVGSATLGSEETAALKCCGMCEYSDPSCSECDGQEPCLSACRACWTNCMYC